MGSVGEKKEIASLDGWRALAVTLVFVAHVGLGNFIPGGLGVTIFFFLSGYLITTLMLRERAKTGSLNLKNFYIRRGLRLLPPMTLVLVVTYALTFGGVLGGQASLQGFLSQWLYFANYYNLAGGQAPLGTSVYWSLAVEEHFYFLFPLLFILVLSRMKRGKAVGLIYLLCVCELVWRLFLVLQGQVTEERTYYATDTRMDSILFGSALAFLQPFLDSRPELRRPIAQWTLVGVGIAGLVLSLVIRDEAFRNTARYTVQGLALTPLFYFSVVNPKMPVFAWLNLRPVMRLGALSYSVYLVHFIVLNNLQPILPQVPLLAAVSIAITWALAWAIDRWIDKPLLAVRQRFR